MSTIETVLQTVGSGKTLTFELAEAFTLELMSGGVSEVQTAGVLAAIAVRGETPDEIAGFASAMRSHGITVQADLGAVDTCGTGGDGLNTFNISTAAAIVAAAAGVPIAKHGNRAATSKSGSADVLEALGVQVDSQPASARACLESCGICFLFARNYHPAMKYAAGPRKQLGFRTIFNVLGPLTNPAGVKRQVLGVYAERLVPIVAEALRQLQSEHALVVHGQDGLDEFSLSGPTYVAELKHGTVQLYEISPSDVGLNAAPVSTLAGGTAVENAAIVEAILSGEQRGPTRDAVLFNAGAALYVGGRASSIREGVCLAADTIDGGRAQATLKQLVRASRQTDFSEAVSH
ncbi:MAG: anthranilate phosphoribosyltransferase [Alicyclobacillaceae bacterium]|nr:anthranilate phosphoribosyltransferase [Alicyclobacillaceae bacterium]